ADGTNATVTVTLKDSGGQPVSDKTVHVYELSCPCSTITPASGVSDASGVVTFTAVTGQTTTTTSSTKPSLGGIATAANWKEAAFYKAFADKTPPDIRPAFEVVADLYAKLAAAFKGIRPG